MIKTPSPVTRQLNMHHTMAAQLIQASYVHCRLHLRLAASWALLWVALWLTWQTSGTVSSLCNDCIGSHKSCPCVELSSEVTLQSKCSDRFPMLLSIQRDCPYTERPYFEKTLLILLLSAHLSCYFKFPLASCNVLP